MYVQWSVSILLIYLSMFLLNSDAVVATMFDIYNLYTKCDLIDDLQVCKQDGHFDRTDVCSASGWGIIESKLC